MQYRGQGSNLFDNLGQRTDHRLHVLRGVLLAEGEPQRRDAEVTGHAHGRQHVRGFDRAGAAGRPRGAGDAGEVEVHEQRLAVRARDGDVRDVRRPLGLPGVDHRVGHDGEHAPLQLVAQCAQPRRRLGLLGRRELDGPAQPDDPRDVFRPRTDAVLLSASVMIASTAPRSRTMRAPTPFAAPILCPEMVTSVQPASLGDRGTLPTACTASEWKQTPAARQRSASRAIGWTVPTSLFTHITLTSATPRASASSSASSSTTPEALTPTRISSPPRCCTACAAASTALCSTADTATRNGPPRSRAASADPMMARLSASVPPEVKITWPGSTPRHSATVRFASSSPARAVRPNRWADDGFPNASRPRYGSIASSTSGRTGVVAALSRYTSRLGIAGESSGYRDCTPSCSTSCTSSVS